jgi:hypothetical protein
MFVKNAPKDRFSVTAVAFSVKEVSNELGLQESPRKTVAYAISHLAEACILLPLNSKNKHKPTL